MTTATDVTLTEFVDAHCHVDLYGKDEAAVIDEIEHRRVHTIAVTNAPSVFFHTREVARGRKYLHPAVGLHPELVASHGHELERMWPHLAETRFVGEIGLDYVTSDGSLRRRQRDIFSQVLAHCAEYGDKVLTVHSRRSASDVIASVGDSFRGRVILHWFSGTLRELEGAICAGFWFSVNPSMIRSRTGQQIVARLPKQRVLTETDGPFVTVGRRPCRPHHVIEVLQGLSRVWRVSLEESTRSVLENYHKVVGFDGTSHKAS
jgi:TatD DNase family protein